MKDILSAGIYLVLGLGLGLLISLTTMSNRIDKLDSQTCELNRSLTAAEFFLQEQYGTKWINYQGHMKDIYNFEFRNCKPITKGE